MKVSAKNVGATTNVALTHEACQVIAALIQPSDRINPEYVFAEDAAWDELHSKLPRELVKPKWIEDSHDN
jgi:hypothetical protein